MRKLALVLFCFVTAAASAVTPRLANERIVLRTIAGDLVLALYPDVAPKTVAQLLKLVRLGVYDGTHFFRLEPSFVLQLGNAQDRLLPLTPEQTGALMKLPLEVAPDLKHAAGSLSMARYDDDPNSAETSFSILLNFAPHLDGKYTVFGHVESGIDALLELVKSQRDSNNRPRTRLTVVKAEVVGSPAELAKTPIAPARAVPIVEVAPTTTGLSTVLPWGLAFVMLVSLVFAWWGPRFAPGRSGSLHLLVALSAAFLLVVCVLPFVSGAQWPGLILMAGLLVLFRSLSRFETV